MTELVEARPEDPAQAPVPVRAGDGPDLASVTRLADSLADLMRSFVRTRQAIMQAAEHDMEWSSQVVLRCLRTRGAMRAGAIAEYVQADPSTISRQVASLVKDGLVQRQADPDDGRASLLVLTEQADGVLAKYDRLRAEYFADMLGDWPEADVHHFATLLDRFATSYKSASEDLVTRKVARFAHTSTAGSVN